MVKLFLCLQVKVWSGRLPNILLLEDDTLFANTLEDFLDGCGFAVDVAHNSEQMLEFSFKNRYDIYLLDVNVPHMSGYELLHELRESGDKTPAIYLTSRRDKEDLKEGYKSGADDYLKKPFDLDELLLRMNALMRRVGIAEIILLGEYSFEAKNNKITDSKDTYELKPKESKLLELLLQRRGNIVVKDEIEDYLWDSSEEISSGALRVYVSSLKKILGQDSIENIRGTGYRLIL